MTNQKQGNNSRLHSHKETGAYSAQKDGSSVRLVDTREYVSMLRDLVRQGHEVSMVVAGNSMSPFIVHQRDSIAFRAPDRELRRGDFVFYERDNGQFVCHRICRVRPEGFFIVGDAQTEIEGPIRRDQIFAIITSVRRKGKALAPGSFWWDFFEKIWIRIIPLRPPLVRLYALWYRVKARCTRS